MKKRIVLMILLCILISGCSSKGEDEASKNNYCDDSAGICGFENKNDNLVDTDFMMKISMEEAIHKMFEKETAVFYFGYPYCPWCKEAVPILKEVAKQFHDKIYYVQTRDSQKELLYTDEERKELSLYLKDYMKEDESGDLKLYVPLVVRIENGKVVDGHLGTVEGHDAHERKMNEEEKEEIMQIYKKIVLKGDK